MKSGTMKSYFKASLIGLPTLMPVSAVSNNNGTFPTLPLEYRQKHQDEVSKEIERRWLKVKEKKKSFSPYKKKSNEEIVEEFDKLNSFRRQIWFRTPEETPNISQEDYMPAQDLLEKGFFRTVDNIAFSYNRTDTCYNASTVLINGHHFIALQEPTEGTINLFFKFLINHGISILVRVKPEGEYSDKGSLNYWEGRLTKSSDSNLLIGLNPQEKNAVWQINPVPIPYFFTNLWVDDKGMDVKELYRLVQEVRATQSKLNRKGPVACHCASGVGRTGTFIAAYILAEMIDQQGTSPLSIEETVLKLSIQRPNLVASAAQYLLLYRFIDLYLELFQGKG